MMTSGGFDPARVGSRDVLNYRQLPEKYEGEEGALVSS
jgi:hypothetical protein